MRPWITFPPRMVTGDPYRFYGYVGRDRVERNCCEREHRKYKGQKLNPAARALRCAERTARRLNRDGRSLPGEGRQ